MDVFDVFGDRLARRILVLASDQALSIDDLADQLNASYTTVYRRVNALVKYDLLKEEIQIDADGNQCKAFETTLQRIGFEIEDGGYNIDVEMRRSLVDQFETFWSDLEQSSPKQNPTPNESANRPRTNEDTPYG